jgi:hydrogenase nickel incorporation protein HypA/HybF
MHELSLVMNIIGIAEEQVQKHHAREVERIELEIGTLAGVEPEAFDFAWHSAIRDTVLGRAQREIITVEARARCPECRGVFTVKDRFQVCPKCHDYLTDFVQGMEFKVKSLTLC